MLTDEVIDEDIEALYAQVNYGKSDIADLLNFQESDANVNKESTIGENPETNIPNKEVSQNSNSNIEEPQVDKVKDSDSTNLIDNIFCNSTSLNQVYSPSPHYIELSTSLISNSPTEEGCIQNTSPAPTQTNASSPVLNNTTINKNHYSEDQFLNRLKVFKENIVWSKQCEKDLKRLQKGKLNDKEFFTLLERRQTNQRKKLKKQDQIRRVFFTRQRKLSVSEVICLSDSDNSDLEIVGVDIVSPAKNPKVVKRNIIMSTNDEDDEIIYVPPPPVPVIDVDEETDSEEEPDAPQEVLDKAQDLDDASNDFLAPTSTSEKFNFSLHGSEFRDAEFVRPANPTDTYETESSTSTSDFNRESSREFNNSVKTIVFNEVDFPREDIFEGNNLEKFGELITPSKEIEDFGAGSKDNDDDDNNSTSKENLGSKPRTTSESSSECDYVEEHSNLPSLSPMVHMNSPKNSQNSHSKVGDESQKNTKTTNILQENDGIIDVDAQSSSSQKRLKRQNSTLIDDFIRKRSKKKKKKLDKVAKSDKVDVLVMSEDEINLSTRLESSKKRGKKKKRQSKTDEEVEDTKKRRPKKKKSSRKTSNEDTILDNSIDDGSTRRTRKRKQKPTTTNDVAIVSSSPSENLVSPAENMQDSLEMIMDEQGNKEVQKSMVDADDAIPTIDTSELVAVAEKVLVETQGEEDEEEEEDVILIEKDIPVHTIESSDSEDDDIQTFDDVGDELELANINEDVDKTASKELDEFDVAHTQSKMSDDPEKWKILTSDRLNFNVSTKRGLRCRKCRQHGHMFMHCPNKSGIPSCTMCGFEGHLEPRCPNRVCFTCAHPSKFSTVSCHRCANQKNLTCYVCQLSGHSANYCPDLWRRYYLTTKEGPLVKPKRKSMNLKPRNKLWCSGCATKGHLEFECSSYKWIKKYPTSSPRVFKFKDVYESEAKNNSRNPNRTDINKEQPSQDNQNNQNTVGTEQVVPLKSHDTETVPPQDAQLDSQESHSTGTSRDLPRHLKPLEKSSSRSVERARSPLRDRRGFRSEQQSFKARLNPFSVWRKPAEPTRFTPYQSMVNPCSVVEVNSYSKATNNVSSFVGSATLGLFNALSNLVNCNIGQQGFAQQPQCSPQPPYSNNYTDFSQSWQNNRDYLDVPYTITSEPSPRGSDYDTRNLQYSQRLSVTDGQRPNINLPEPSNNTQEGFLSLTLNPIEFQPPFKPVKFNNVEEVTAKKFIHSSIEDLNEFLSSEIVKLDNIKNSDAKIYKKKLNNIEQLRKIDLKTNSVKKQIYFQYKHINMFLFGIQQLADGKRNIDILRNFVYQPGRQLFDGKRNALLAAYGYIFGGEHPNFNYRKHLNALSVGQRRHERTRP